MAAPLQRIIMNHTTAPSTEDLQAMADDILQSLPDEIASFCEDLTIAIEEWPDENAESDADDPYDLVALYKSGKQVSPGVEKKSSSVDDVFILYRRPILDMWSETGEDLSLLVRQIMIEELGKQYEFTDDEIDDMARRHYQGLP